MGVGSGLVWAGAGFAAGLGVGYTAAGSRSGGDGNDEPLEDAEPARPEKKAVDPSSGDAKKGKKVFVAKCASCHNVVKDGPNTQGPNLWGIIGKQTGQAPGFKYTKANKSSGVTWSNQTMFDYLANPKKYIKGTNMAFPGFKKEQDRADVVAYLNTLTNEPTMKLPTAKDKDAPAPAAK